MTGNDGVRLAWTRNKIWPVVVHADKCRGNSWCWGNYIIFWYFISTYYPEGVGRYLVGVGQLGTLLSVVLPGRDLPCLGLKTDWTCSINIPSRRLWGEGRELWVFGSASQSILTKAVLSNPKKKVVANFLIFQPWCGHQWPSRVPSWRERFSPRREVLVDPISFALVARSSSLSVPTQLSTRECCSRHICIRLWEEAPST